jgi:ankyrin repeat protein
MQLLLKKGTDVNAKGREHGTALRAAIYGGNEALVGLLVENKADLNRDGGNYAALKMAVECGWQEGRIYRVLKVHWQCCLTTDLSIHLRPSILD